MFVFSTLQSPSSNYAMASCSLFISKSLHNCYRESILSEKEESLNEQREVKILDEANEKPQNVIQNKDLTAVSVAQVMTDSTQKNKC